MSWLPVRVAGAVALLGAIVAWAWTLTELTPHMPRMREIAPMPGGDGEVFLWVAELRWAAILLAALGLVAVAVTAPRAPVAGMGLAGALIIADAVLARDDPAGRLLPALVVGLAAIVGVWFAAGTVTGEKGEEIVDARQRLAVVGVTGTACGPLLLVQGTPAVNHPSLPDTMGATHAMVIGLLVVLGGTAALAARRPEVAALAVVAAIVVAAPFVVLGLLSTRGVEPEATMTGALVAPTLAIGAYAVARPAGHRPWGVLVAGLTSLICAVMLVGPLAVLSAIPAEILFSIAGTGYPADGLSVLPGVALGTPFVVAALAKRAREPVSR